MRRALSLVRLLAWLALLACVPARADTALSLYKSFRGTVNFTGTEATLRAYPNTSYSYNYGTVNTSCTLVSSGAASAVLKGIPSGASILSAQLYWAGSGNTIDASVNMDGNAIAATRSFQSTTVGNGYNYFSAAADVTAAVKSKGNGTYTFSGLSVATGSPWCDAQGVLAGFALVVVYSASSEPFRMLNIYEGFQYFQYNGLTINLGDFNVPDPLPSTVTGRIGHVTWEGDSTLSGSGESLLFNGVELTDSMNPSGNQFNSQSNITSDSNSYGVDFDAYTLTGASGAIAPGQSSATTTYKTGQDMVLLSSEIVAMPYVATSDLALTMTRYGDLLVNTTASYVLSVANKGLDPEAGPVTVTDTLPANLQLVSYTGSGWTCTSAAGTGGATVVTCTQNGPVAANATMSALTLNVTTTVLANYTNTATVSGKTSDTNSANNTATNTYTLSSSTYGYGAVFTRETCTNGQLIVVKANDTGCHTFTGPVVAGASDTKIYVTGITVNSSGKQVASALSTTSTSVPVDLMVSCQPSSGVTATYAGLTLVCGAYQTVYVTFSGNQATAANVSSFFYADVGRVTLSAKYQGNVVGTISFISKPYDIRVRDVIRADGYSDQFGMSASYTDVAFARVGEPFTLRLGALTADSTAATLKWAPSFGKEQAALSGKGVMDDSQLVLNIGLDKFAVTAPQAGPVMPLVKTSSGDDVSGLAAGAFVVNQNFAASTDPNAPPGSVDANISYFEAGNLALTPSLNGYLGTGDTIGGPPANVDPASQSRLTYGTRVTGRFYPDHFEINVLAIDKGPALFDCLPAMNCPAAYDAAKPAWPVAGVVYSGQPFAVKVIPVGLPRPDGLAYTMKLFQNVPPSGTGAAMTSTARTTLALSPVVAPNGAVLVKNSAGQTVKFASPALPNTALPYSSAATDFSDMNTTAAMGLPPGFDPASRLGNNWGVPTFFYVRASMNETRGVPGAAPQTVTVSSIAPATPAGTQYERGLLAVNGRLQVANALGSEALRLPVALTAQYWNGSAWLTNTNDSSSMVGANAPAVAPAPACTRALASSSAGACKSGVVTVASGAAGIQLNNGKGTLILQQAAPGRLNGTIDYQVDGGASAAWLPSTRARATFGLYKAPVIYLREVY